MDPQVAVVVVSYNTKGLLLECLASVLTSAPAGSVKLMVVDNGSEDGSYEAVREVYPGAATIRNAANLGFGAACNQGIRATGARFILLLNSDAVLSAEAFQVMKECLEQNERCGAAGCRLVDAAGDEVINTRNFLTPFNQALELAGIKGPRLAQRTRRPRPDRNDCSVDWIDGACLMVRRSAVDQVGMFDEQFFMYSEDEDLCLRLRRDGWLVCFCGAGTAVHYGAASSRLHKTEMLRQFFLSQMRFLGKHRSRRAISLYTVLMKTVLILKCWFLRDAGRRGAARELLAALREATAA